MKIKNKKLKLILKTATYTLVLPIILIVTLLELLSSVYDADSTYCKSLQFSKPVKNAMVIVPHQDDEVFTGGGIIERLTKQGINTTIVFFTDGNSNDDIGGIRQLEAIESCKQLGCDSEDVICLQFPNRQQNDTTDASGVSSTALRDSMKCTLKELVASKQPDYILCTDFDFHRDHRTLSLIFDEAVGELLQDNLINMPIIHKGFAYQTSYNAVPDFYAINIKSTQKPLEQQNPDYETDIPAYSWNNRLRIPLEEGSITHTAFRNTQYKAFSEHKTQCVTMKAYSVLNGDNVYWERRTDNLLYKGDIIASSGNTKHLCDFKLVDTKDVTIKHKQNVEFSNCLWEPSIEDANPTIDVVFADQVTASYLRFYEDFSYSENIIDIEIVINDTIHIHSGKLNNNGAPSLIAIGDDVKIKNLKFTNFRYNGNRPALAEIELLPTLFQEKRVVVNKIIEKTSKDFIYKYYVDGDIKELALGYYSSDNRQLSLKITESQGGADLKGETLNIEEDFCRCKIVLLDKNQNVYDKVEIERLNSLELHVLGLIQKYDQTKLSLVNAFYRNRLVHSIIKHTIFKAIKRNLGL